MLDPVTSKWNNCFKHLATVIPEILSWISSYTYGDVSGFGNFATVSANTTITPPQTFNSYKPGVMLSIKWRITIISGTAGTRYQRSTVTT